MAEVYLAQDTVLERPVAIKILAPHLCEDTEHRKRFRAEAKAASALAHPNICVIHEVGETPDGRPFLAMEYVPGPTLEKLRAERPLQPIEVLRLGQETAEALDAAHSHGIIHRDIKPSNIMLDKRGHAKLLDFGLAKWLGREEQAGPSLLAQTNSGALIGTPFYMSPEQALGHQVDARTDIFCLGAVLYELISGKRPFPGNTLGETLNNLINRPPEPLDLSGFSPELGPIISRCLEKEPENRYPSAAALALDLARLRGEAEGNCANGRRGPFAIGLAVMVCAALVAGAYGLFHFRHAARLKAGGKLDAARVIQHKSLAVLPFDNFSLEPGTDYLSDGLTEEITTTLAQVQGLKVAARNSAFSFKGSRDSARLIGAKLKVRTLLTGSIRKVGGQLRVSAQLVNAADGFPLWSETYNGSIDDILSFQEDIARRIADRLQVGAGAPRVRKLPKPEAHRAYLLARHFWNKRTESSLTNAVRLFAQAIALDPLYSEAHSGLAASYLLLPNYAQVRRASYLPLARAEAQRALELDPASAEAHCIFAQLEWAAHNLKAAEEHFKRALQVAPNYATALHWHGQFLTVHGRPREGLAALVLAVDLDPLSPIIRNTISEWHYLQGDADRAIQEARSVIEVFPDFPVARVMLSYALISKRQYPEALNELARARQIPPVTPEAYQDVSAYALARSGREPEARAILGRYETKRAEGKSVDASLALIYTSLREFDKALDALERIAEADVLEDTILCDPFYRDLLPLPRFKALIRKAGFEPMG